MHVTLKRDELRFINRLGDSCGNRHRLRGRGAVRLGLRRRAPPRKRKRMANDNQEYLIVLAFSMIRPRSIFGVHF